jgi:hypothetical protein
MIVYDGTEKNTTSLININGVKPLIHESSPFSRKQFLSLCSIVKTTEWNGLIKIDN